MPYSVSIVTESFTLPLIVTLYRSLLNIVAQEEVRKTVEIATTKLIKINVSFYYYICCFLCKIVTFMQLRMQRQIFFTNYQKIFNQFEKKFVLLIIFRKQFISLFRTWFLSV